MEMPSQVIIASLVRREHAATIGKSAERSFLDRSVPTAADDSAASPPLSWVPADGDHDPVIEALNAALNIAGDGSRGVSRLFVDSIQNAIKAHLAYARGPGNGAPPRNQRLSRWQERRAKAFLALNAGEGVSIAEAAEICKLSRNYFIRAFKNTTGETPYRWLNRHRVERAKQLLLGDTSIAEIAIDCGFADQSHLTRVFAKMTGLPPGTWRREYRGLEGSAAETAMRLADAAG